MCIKGGLKFNEGEEERCPKASHLTIAGVIKALIESEVGDIRGQKQLLSMQMTIVKGVDMRHI